MDTDWAADIYRLGNIDWNMDTLYEALGTQYDRSTIDIGWMRYFNSDQRSEYVYYLLEEAEETLQEMMKQFIEDSLLPTNQEGFVEEITLAGRIAQETGLELINEPTHLFHTKFIEAKC
ncbi:hypothetical protein BI308_23135 [Roseofilum reptotaenium AO1-A]|uniref:Uncharacterized protein n=1 Tax=Roseofilum reptotaenium AO1-A TaxID=1925591 RepID=A0A1L9QKK0_9CYAN|nr:hypothetical protein BI308_23135 [Roseofilum reptotaenium AO1-A]